MKVNELLKAMADFGTRPHVQILKYVDDSDIGGHQALIYEGTPEKASGAVRLLKVNSIVALGIGYIRIYAQ